MQGSSDTLASGCGRRSRLQNACIDLSRAVERSRKASARPHRLRHSFDIVRTFPCRHARRVDVRNDAARDPVPSPSPSATRLDPTRLGIITTSTPHLAFDASPRLSQFAPARHPTLLRPNSANPDPHQLHALPKSSPSALLLSAPPNHLRNPAALITSIQTAFTGLFTPLPRSCLCTRPQSRESCASPLTFTLSARAPLITIHATFPNEPAQPITTPPVYPRRHSHAPPEQ